MVRKYIYGYICVKILYTVEGKKRFLIRSCLNYCLNQSRNCYRSFILRHSLPNLTFFFYLKSFQINLIQVEIGKLWESCFSRERIDEPKIPWFAKEQSEGTIFSTNFKVNVSLTLSNDTSCTKKKFTHAKFMLGFLSMLAGAFIALVNLYC